MSALPSLKGHRASCARVVRCRECGWFSKVSGRFLLWPMEMHSPDCSAMRTERVIECHKDCERSDADQSRR